MLKYYRVIRSTSESAGHRQRPPQSQVKKKAPGNRGFFIACEKLL
jgi:hypothetical protein